MIIIKSLILCQCQIQYRVFRLLKCIPYIYNLFIITTKIKHS
jgi:hypothetical protein